MGSKGWELVSVVAHADDGISVFYWKQQNLSIHEHESDFEIVVIDDFLSNNFL